MNEEKTYSAMDVAIHIINYTNDKQNWTMNIFKLQRILFFLQGFWLSSKHQHRLFFEDMMAYPYGPAVPKVQEYFRQHGGNSIPPVRYQIEQENPEDIFSLSRKPWIDPISETDAEEINLFCDKFKDVSGTYLLELCNNMFPCYYRNINRIIDDEDMQMDFTSLLLPKKKDNIQLQKQSVLEAWNRIRNVAEAQVSTLDILLIEKIVQDYVEREAEHG